MTTIYMHIYYTMMMTVSYTQMQQTWLETQIEKIVQYHHNDRILYIASFWVKVL